MLPRKFQSTYGGVRHDRIGDIRKDTPDVTHPTTKLFGPSYAGKDIPFSRIEPTDECTYTGTSDLIDWNPGFF